MTKVSTRLPAKKTAAQPHGPLLEPEVAQAAQRSASQKPAPAQRKRLPVEARDLLESIADTSVHWWSLIESVLEVHSFHKSAYPEPVDPLPQWAVDRLNDNGKHRASYDDHAQKRRLLEDWLHMAQGDGHQYRYEVWTSRGSRLAFRHESWEEARKKLEALKASYPDACKEAFVARVHVLNFGGIPTDPALLDTMIGAVSHIGTFMGTATERGEEEFTVQDETGRQVTVPASVLRAHPVYERLEKQGKASLDFYLERVARRAATKEQGQ